MPQSIPGGLKREHVLQSLSDLDGGAEHPFGKPTGYDLVYKGRRYPPKAVTGLACRYSLGRVLLPEEFSGGEAPGQANFVLRRLGFTVVAKTEEMPEPRTGREWTPHEVRLIVADYFAMLDAETLGKRYRKSEHRKALAPKLDGRSSSSIEFKHQNVSAVLAQLGLPYVEGYKPASNYQALLATEVQNYLDQHRGFLEALAAAPSLNPTVAQPVPVTALDTIVEDPPTSLPAPAPEGKPWRSRKPRTVDFAERDAANRTLGRLGEQFVFDFEQTRLRVAGRDDLAPRVEWVAQSVGDGLGFDILSFDEADDSERMLEVKTTGLGKLSPFYVTANEVRCSEDIPEQYLLFRVFHFSRSPRLYILHGALSQLCQLDPLVYRATISARDP